MNINLQDLENEYHLQPSHVDATIASFTHVKNGELTVAEEGRVKLKQAEAKKTKNFAQFLATLAQINFQQRQQTQARAS